MRITSVGSMEGIIFDFHSSLLDQDMDFTKVNSICHSSNLLHLKMTNLSTIHFSSSQNSDDPLGVQALLAILRSQQDDPSSSSIDLDQSNPSSSSYSPNDATFINKHPENGIKDPRLASRTQYQHSDQAREKEKQKAKEQLQSMSFSKALPILTKLAADQDFLRELIKVRVREERYTESRMLTLTSILLFFVSFLYLSYHTINHSSKKHKMSWKETSRRKERRF